MSEINWTKVWMEFEKEMRVKLKNLPDPGEVKGNLKPLRKLISQTLLETTSAQTFKTLIDLLLKEKAINLPALKKKYLNPELKKEKELLEKKKKEFEMLKKSAQAWVGSNFSEEKLKELWEKQQSWLPRRSTIYKNKTSLQKIAADTLSRFKLINKI
ncbi:hypothetical protein MUP35_00635 [Patescibacteria group bacterium]|nr:hypothetical protein [Patescibacteria group bacterium]